MATRKAPRSWGEFVEIRARYQRSVHLERDVAAEGWLDGYLLTPLVRSLLDRIVAGLSPEGTARAWSLTGPYGSGKSAFALYLSQVLGTTGANERARRLLKTQDSELHKAAFGRHGVALAKTGLVPVLATGERASLEHILIRALAKSAEGFWSGPGAKPSVLGDVREALAVAEAGGELSTRRVTRLFEEVATKVSQSGLPGAGLLLVLDEAGKPLEHVARRGSDGADVHLLQELAELASRSGDAPIVFLVLLHQSFDQYAAELPTTQRNEWAKVQGRFSDAPFHEASDQLLRLIAAAMARGAEPPRAWRASTDKLAKRVSVVLRESDDEQRQLYELFRDVAPLHPLVALALGPLFRSRLAQNERSLFAFLGAPEPKGFREFLDESSDTPSVYELDRLYDYVRSTFGERLYGRQGRTWARVEDGLTRLPPDASELDARILKTVGILSAVGDEIPASDDVLKAALCVAGGPTPKDVDASLARLQASSHLVFRRYRNAYQLWDGSDLDLDALVAKALDEVPASGSLHQRLAKVAPPRPILVRRHSMTTGTLRFFEVRYSDESLLKRNLQPASSHADGFVWLVLPSSEREAEGLRRELTSQLFWECLSERPVVIAVPHNAAMLRAAARDLAALEFVQANTPELRDDPVARHELDGRIADAEQRIRLELEALSDGTTGCDWCHGGELLAVAGAAPLSRHLSNICDKVYSAAPYIHNELLNRNQLSSAAAAARRNLMTAMVEHPGTEKLGITGFPPEYSMYRSVLEAHGLHVAGADGWELSQPPKRAKKGSLRPAWEAVQRALENSEQARLSLPDLYAQLRRPPYGVKEGVLPVLVLAAMLESMHEIALYEESGFIPGITAPIVERMLRAPERFELQRFRLSGARASVFEDLVKSLTTGGPERPRSIVPVVRALVRLVSNLPQFARNTHTVSLRAQRVREALLRAREPGPLLFEKLPEACDCQPFDDGAAVAAQVHQFTHRLREALGELESAYPDLLQRIEDMLREGFDASDGDADFREELASRAHRLIPAATDTRLKSFLVRTMDDGLDREEWLVSLGTLLGKKPPESWYDQDIEAAYLSARLLTRRFRTLETLLDAQVDDLPSGTTLIRVAIAELGATEREQVVSVRATDQKLVEQCEAQLLDLVHGFRATLPRDAIVGALARVARDFMETDDGREAERGDRQET